MRNKVVITYLASDSNKSSLNFTNFGSALSFRRSDVNKLLEMWLYGGKRYNIRVIYIIGDILQPGYG